MSETIPTRKLLTRKEAAAYITANFFQISPKTLAIYASEDAGPPYRILGGAAHYTRADIDAWINRPEHDGIVKPSTAVQAGPLPGGALAPVLRR